MECDFIDLILRRFLVINRYYCSWKWLNRALPIAGSKKRRFHPRNPEGGNPMSAGDKSLENRETGRATMRRFGRAVLFALLFAGCVSALWNCDGGAALTYTIETPGKDVRGPLAPLTKVTYSNGLTALIKEAHSSPIVTVDVWCHTGAAAEKEGIGGISHFFEHMFFKGTAKHPSGEMDRIIKGLGGINNAGTSIEYTHYYVTVPSDNYLVAVDVLSDALMNSSFNTEELNQEREVVESEIRRKEDSPASLIFVIFQKQFAAGSPYEKPVLGTSETLATINRQTFLDYLGEKYTAGNAVVVVTGDVNTEEIAKAIGEYFEPMKQGKSPFPDFTVQELKSDKIGEERKDVKQGYMILGFVTKGLKNPRENSPAEVAAAILGEGKRLSALSVACRGEKTRECRFGMVLASGQRRCAWIRRHLRAWQGGQRQGRHPRGSYGSGFYRSDSKGDRKGQSTSENLFRLFH